MTYQEAFELIATHSEAFKMLPDKLKAKRVIYSIHSKVKFSEEKLKELIIEDDTQFI